MALPGFNTDIRDGYVVPAATPPSTEKITIIGMALDGPVDKPMRVSSFSEAERLFGPIVYKNGYKDCSASPAESGAWSGNSLIQAAWEAFSAGAGNIELVRVGGVAASSATAFGGSLSVTAIYPGTAYNAATLTVATGATNYTVTITQNSSKGLSPLAFTVPAATTNLAQFCAIVNSYPGNNSVKVTVAPEAANLFVSSLTSGVATLASGTYGTRAPGDTYASSVAALYTQMTSANGTFALLGDLETSIVLMAGVYADDVVGSGGTKYITSMAQELGEFVFNLTKENYPAIGVIGLYPVADSTPVDAKATADNSWGSAATGQASGAYVTGTVNERLKMGYLMKNGFTYSDPDSGATVDIGRAVIVCAGTAVGNHRDLGNYLTSPASYVAGLISATPANIGITNKVLPGIQGILTNLPKATISTLIDGIGKDDTTSTLGGGAYVVLRHDYLNGGVRVVKDVTASKRASDFTGLTTIRITNLVVKTVQSILNPYISKPYKETLQRSMETDLRAGLQSLADKDCLVGGEGQGFGFKLTPYGSGTYTDILVELFIRPVTQISGFRLIVTVN